MSSISFPKLAKGPPSRCENGWTKDTKNDRHTGAVNRLGRGEPHLGRPGCVRRPAPRTVILWGYPDGSVGWDRSWGRSGGCRHGGGGGFAETPRGVSHSINQALSCGFEQHPRRGHDSGLIGPI